jgi:hypothetical protein
VSDGDREMYVPYGVHKLCTVIFLITDCNVRAWW